MTISQFGIDWFLQRGISPETAVRYGVSSGRSVGTKKDPKVVWPDEKGPVLVFPYAEFGSVVAEHYRTEPKFFWQKIGGRKTFWNSDVLDDPALLDGRNALVITEGEPDALAVIESGYPFVVSVPDGAPAVAKGDDPKKLKAIDPEEEIRGKFQYMWNNKDRLRKIKRFVLAVDADDPGRRLEAELLRRLSPARCSYVEYPTEAKVVDDGVLRPCKDLNEVLTWFGPERVIALIAKAKPYPVRGIYRLDQYQERQLATYSTGWPEFRNCLRVYPGEFMVVTGIPGSGKSTWVVNLVANLCSSHNWRAAMCTPEMPTMPLLRDVLRRYWLGRKPVLSEGGELKRADAWINNRFVFIDIDPTGTGEADEPFDLDWVIDRATEAVLRDSVRILVIDPWNELEHARAKGENSADYHARAIRALKRFGKLHEVMVIVVAHPTKDVLLEKGGGVRAPELYDIEGAAHWYNKCDHGVVIHRDRKEGSTKVMIKKVRVEGSEQDGGAGFVRDIVMFYDKEKGVFSGDPPKGASNLSKEDTDALAGR